MLGVFASTTVNTQTGLLEGDFAFFGKEVIAVAIGCIYAFIFTYVMLAIINKITPVRVPTQVEHQGIDTALHGEKAYDEGVL